MVKKIITYLLATTILLATALSVPAFAEEVGSNHIYRWGYTYVNSSGDVTKCRLKINGDYLTGVASSYYSDTVNHWNTLDVKPGYYDDKVYAYNVAFANSKCDLYTSAANSWIYTESAYTNKDAVTIYKNYLGQWSIDPLTGIASTFSSGTITYGCVYYKAMTNFTTNRVKYTMRHEIGHILGMGHVPLDSNSLLVPSYVNNLYYVCIYDIDVLEGFYPNP